MRHTGLNRIGAFALLILLAGMPGLLQAACPACRDSAAAQSPDCHGRLSTVRPDCCGGSSPDSAGTCCGRLDAAPPALGVQGPADSVVPPGAPAFLAGAAAVPAQPADAAPVCL
jgi:hypothetical protein